MARNIIVEFSDGSDFVGFLFLNYTKWQKKNIKTGLILLNP